MLYTNTTNERTVIASAAPLAGAGDTLLLMFPAVEDNRRNAALLADQCSLAHDFVARQKVGGTHLKYHVKRQITNLPPDRYTETDLDFIVPRVLELMYTAADLAPWARDLGYHGDPFPWDPERRALIRVELDAAYFHLYGIDRDDVPYIMDSFPIVKRRDEREFGEYRTKRVILEIYDEMTDAMRRGVPYQTRLNPRPALAMV